MIRNVLFVMVLMAGVACAGDDGWLHWRGPQQNGTSLEKGLPDTWEVEGKNHLWSIQLKGRGTKLRAGIFYPSGGMLKTGIWTTKRNRPQELARVNAPPEGSETTFEEFMDTMKKVGFEPAIQDLDELAEFALEGIRNEDFVIMIGREQMEAQLVERAKKLAAGECPIELGP